MLLLHTIIKFKNVEPHELLNKSIMPFIFHQQITEELFMIYV